MPALDLLVFDLAGQRYAIPLAAVREVLRAVSIAPLPSAPAIVEGVVNLRGRPVPVLDLRQRLGIEPRELDPSEHFIIAEIGGRPVAFRVDRADRVARMDAGVVTAADSIGRGVQHVAHIAGDAAGVIYIHDPAAFLSDVEAGELNAALRGDGA